jgi:hypothetical protein
METYTTLKAQYDRVFSKHRLRMVLNNEPFRAYMLEPEEGGRLNGVLIMFTPEGIVIMGDHAPTRTGICATGYDQAWFSARKNPEYLMEKFGMDREWQADLAVEYCNDELKEFGDAPPEEDDDDESDGQRMEWTELRDNIAAGDTDQHGFYAFLQERNTDEWYARAIGFNPNVMAKLTAIQHCFAQLMGELGMEEKAKEPVAAQA